LFSLLMILPGMKWEKKRKKNFCDFLISQVVYSWSFPDLTLCVSNLSMADNRSKELAFESVALISKALSLLEAGQLGVVSFGEQVQLLHPLHDTFNDTSGPR
jgi:hypothetical protein